MIRKLQFGRAGAPIGEAKQVVVFLHGYGADGADLLSLSDPLAPHMPTTAFYAPDAPEPCKGTPFGRQWFAIPRFDGSTELQSRAGMNAASADLNEFIDHILTTEGLRADRLILLGFSQGAMMALHVAPRRDLPIAGVVAISGRLIDPIALAGEAKVKPEVLLVHGDRDDVVPFGEMHLAGQALQEAGFAAYAHVMQGTGHGIAPDGLQVALAFMKQRLKLA
jgi:phospholipase/carboxylesterase